MLGPIPMLSYFVLAFEGEKPVNLKCFTADQAVYLSSFTTVTHQLVKLPIFLLLKVDSFVINI